MDAALYGPIFFFLSVASVALFSFIAVASWSESRRLEREAYYKSETIKKIADSATPGATAALAFMQEQENIALRKRREGLRVGGLSTVAAGFALTIFLAAAAHGGPAFTLGLIPTFVGAALLLYSYKLAPKEQ